MWGRLWLEICLVSFCKCLISNLQVANICATFELRKFIFIYFFSCAFTNFTQNFIGYIYEDKKGNIWTGSESANDQDLALPRYDEKTLAGLVSANGQWVLSCYDEKYYSKLKIRNKTQLKSVFTYARMI